jgi:hypothetical protein
MKRDLRHKALTEEFLNLPEDDQYGARIMYGSEAKAVSAYIANTRGSYGLPYNETPKERQKQV